MLGWVHIDEIHLLQRKHINYITQINHINHINHQKPASLAPLASILHSIITKVFSASLSLYSLGSEVASNSAATAPSLISRRYDTIRYEYQIRGLLFLFLWPFFRPRQRWANFSLLSTTPSLPWIMLNLSFTRTNYWPDHTRVGWWEELSMMLATYVMLCYVISSWYSTVL